MRRSPIRRRTELKPRSRLERSPMVRKATTNKLDFTPAVKRQVTQRSGGWCEFPGCKRAATRYHHRLMRSHGGPGTVENCMHLCNSCHLHVHAHPARSYENGWLIRSS